MCLPVALLLIVIQLCAYGSEGNLLPELLLFSYTISYLFIWSPPILGTPVEIGRLPNLQHGIRGTLYALDETTLFIEGFEYDGLGPG